jgi:hypothetical protein
MQIFQSQIQHSKCCTQQLRANLEFRMPSIYVAVQEGSNGKKDTGSFSRALRGNIT